MLFDVRMFHSWYHYFAYKQWHAFLSNCFLDRYSVLFSSFKSSVLFLISGAEGEFVFRLWTLPGLGMLWGEPFSLVLLSLAEIRKPSSVSNPFSLQQWIQAAVVQQNRMIQRKNKKYILVMNTWHSLSSDKEVVNIKGILTAGNN